MGPPFNNEEFKMAQYVEVKQTCAQCQGTGIYKGGSDSPLSCPWPGCNGTGEYVIGHIHLDPGLDELETKLNDIMDKCNDIAEAIEGLE